MAAEEGREKVFLAFFLEFEYNKLILFTYFSRGMASVFKIFGSTGL